MHIQTIVYQRTFNLGNYSSEKIGVEFAINQGESAAFWLINTIYSASFWFHWLFFIFPLIGVLLLYTVNKTSGNAKPKRK